MEEINIIKSDSKQKKCPSCGATDIELNPITGKLRCNYCKHEFEEEKAQGFEENISNLTGTIIGAGAQNIDEEANTIITLKCESCGAELTINASESTQAQCPWCRNYLSVNTQVPNASIPDVILPFKTTREEAFEKMKSIIEKKKFLLHPDFINNFNMENIKGIYLPYMVIDVNGHAKFKGVGEVTTAEHEHEDSEGKEYYTYDVDIYKVEREFDIQIEGITQTADSAQLGKNKKATNENRADFILYSLMPFDTENAVAWDANFLKGYTLEKRNINIGEISDNIGLKAKDIARHKINGDMQYDRGVKWSEQELEIYGQQWKSAYFPVWVYSHTQNTGKKGYTYYLAQNARTGETNYSMRINWARFLLFSAIGVALSPIIPIIGILGICLPIIITVMAFNNSGTRYPYETASRAKLSNIFRKDDYVKHKKNQTRSHIKGKNSDMLEGKDKYDS